MGEIDKDKFREIADNEGRPTRATKEMGFEYPNVDNRLLTSEVDEEPKKPNIRAKKAKADMQIELPEVVEQNLTSSSLSLEMQNDSQVQGHDPNAVKLVTEAPETWTHRFFFKSYQVRSNMVVRAGLGLIFTISLFVLAIMMRKHSQNVSTFEIDYGTACQDSFPGVCEVPINVASDIETDTIYIFLSISNMPQAIKEFTEHFSLDQLKNIPVSQSSLFKDCGGKQKINQLDYSDTRFDIKKIDFDNPCGYLPSMFPSDIFTEIEFLSDRNLLITIESLKIVDEHTRVFDKKSAKQSVDVTQPQFSNWMVT